MSLYARLTGDTTPLPVADTHSDGPKHWGAEDLPPVAWSADLGRVLEIPRRDLTTAHSPADIAALEARLRRTGPCVCAKLSRPCPTSLRLVQAQALLEIPQTQGGIVAAGTGHGKSLVDLLMPMAFQDCKKAVLFVPASLRAPMLERDALYYGAHWHLPDIVGSNYRWSDGRPELHVLTYNQISHKEFGGQLRRIAPDLIICDEAQNFKALTSSRTVRFLRYLDEFPATRLVILSGTVASRSVKDFAHLSARALRERSPLPLRVPTVKEWAGALDPGDNPAPPGMLEKLCAPGENVRVGFRRRRNDTKGVVWTEDASTDAGLVIRAVRPHVPPGVTEHLRAIRRGVRPDGEVLPDKLHEAACARQMACGFFHKWVYPRGEPEPLRVEWFALRQAFNRELRAELKHPEEGRDSPGLLVDAAIRAHQQPAYTGSLPVWHSYGWPAWAAIMGEVRPLTETEWVDDFAVRHAADWACEAPGIVWVEFPELGRRIAEAAGVPWYGRGPKARLAIEGEAGRRSVVASIDAHGTGRNLQMFRRNLVCTPPADGAQWEQLISRTHRAGQTADEVTVDVYQHTAEYREAFDKARNSYAVFIEETDGSRQRLRLATYDDTWQ